MALMLHAGAKVIDYDDLRSLMTPVPTATHVPIPHSAVVDMVRYSLGFFGHEVVDEDYGVTPDGMRFFGLLSLRSTYGDYTDTVGLRNSHDKTFPIGISVGSRVFVCDNLAFIGDHIIRRKHTANAKRDLPGLVAEVIEPLRDHRLAQARTFERYRARRLVAPEFDHLTMQLYRRGGLNVTRIADVVEAYERPPFDWGDETAWRAFNAVTFALRGRVAESPNLTRTLHTVIDGFCEPHDDQQRELLGAA